jgi:hypothetical protein
MLLCLIYTKYAVGAFAFGRAVLSFVGGWIFRAERGKSIYRRSRGTLLPQAESRAIYVTVYVP